MNSDDSRNVADADADGPHDNGGDEPPGDEAELDDVDVKDLLRRALEPPAERAKKITSRVQHTIRDESRGRFFADGWSTSDAPRATFLVTSLLMLLIVVLTWLLISPLGL